MYYYTKLRSLRTEIEKTQTEIASMLNTSRKQYSRWETGEDQIPFDKVIMLAEYYDVSVDYIAGPTNFKKKNW